jgi:uncharacterized membrane protein
MQYEVSVIALILFFFLLVILLLWICRDQSRLNGRVDSLREEMKSVRDECYALRERLRKSEISSLQHQESATAHSSEENEK